MCFKIVQYLVYFWTNSQNNQHVMKFNVVYRIQKLYVYVLLAKLKL